VQVHIYNVIGKYIEYMYTHIDVIGKYIKYKYTYIMLLVSTLSTSTHR